jgi:CubicO group peptidase (beta-lactamase class C family)
VTGVRGSDVLAERLRSLLGRKHQVVAAAAVAPGEVHVTSIGAARGADFEIGSISKGVTGLLYADAVDRGEITPSTTLGDLLVAGRRGGGRADARLACRPSLRVAPAPGIGVADQKDALAVAERDQPLR